MKKTLAVMDYANDMYGHDISELLYSGSQFMETPPYLSKERFFELHKKKWNSDLLSMLEIPNIDNVFIVNSCRFYKGKNNMMRVVFKDNKITLIRLLYCSMIEYKLSHILNGRSDLATGDNVIAHSYGDIIYALYNGDLYIDFCVSS